MNLGILRLRQRCQGLIDLFWPSVKPHTQQEIESEKHKQEKLLDRYQHRARTSHGSLDELRESLAGCQSVFGQELSRRGSVERRLTTITGLTSVAAAVSLALLTFVVHGGARAAGFWEIAAGILVAYVVAQIICALLAAVRGLHRRSWEQPDFAAILPGKHSSEEHLQQQILAIISSTHQHRQQIDDQVTQMAVAHRALQNFAVGIGGLVALLLALMIFGTAAAAQRDPLVEQIRGHPELIELLRGPPGLQGPPGAPGQPGAPCSCPDSTKIQGPTS